MTEELRNQRDVDELDFVWSMRSFKADFQTLPDDWKGLLVEEYNRLGGTLDTSFFNPFREEGEGPMGEDQEGIRIK